MMSFEKLSKVEVKPSSTYTLFSNVHQMGVESVTEVAKSRVESVESDIFHGSWYGFNTTYYWKKVETINKLGSLGSWAEIHVEKTTGKINILGSDRVTMVAFVRITFNVLQYCLHLCLYCLPYKYYNDRQVPKDGIFNFKVLQYCLHLCLCYLTYRYYVDRQFPTDGIFKTCGLGLPSEPQKSNF